MADALVSPIVGGAAWAVVICVAGYSIKKIKADDDTSMTPLMGVLGAFVFAAQMINFSIPLTGSSGHLGGGLLLAIILGPHRALLTISSILFVQAMFFADGGLFALGCNIINMGIIPAYIAYPLVYRLIAGDSYNVKRITAASVASALLALEAGAFTVSVVTVLSGITELKFSTFLSVMMPIHLPIGLIEGIVTAAVVMFIRNTRPEILNLNTENKMSFSGFVAVFLISAVLIGGVLSYFASGNPDGLEWSISKTTPHEVLANADTAFNKKIAEIQDAASFMPDYSFKHEDGTLSGTSYAGVFGGLITLILCLGIGAVFRIHQRRATS
jgi:cobalt/nickel transport system permease protein